MLSRLTVVALMLALGAVACAPPALDADHASNSSAETGGKSSKSKGKSKTPAKADADDDGDLGDDDETAAPKGKTQSGTPDKTAGTPAASSTPASFAAVYSALNPSCGSCHLSGAANAPVFFGDDAAGSYQSFKDMNFAVDPSPLATKGAHAGPALTAEQDSAVAAWVADETK